MQNVCHIQLSHHSPLIEDHERQASLFSLVVEQVGDHRSGIDGISNPGSRSFPGLQPLPISLK